MRYIFSYLKPYKWRILFQTIIKVIGTMIDLIVPLLLAIIIDDIVPKKDKELIFIYGGIMMICCIIGITFNIIANKMASQVARNITKEIRKNLFTKTLSLSQKQIDEKGVPSLVLRMSSDTYNVHQMLGMIQRIAVRAPILLFGGIILTIILDATLSLVLIAVLPFISFVAFSTSRKSVPLFTKLQTSNDDMILKVRETQTGIRVIKALSTEELEVNRFDEKNKKCLESGKKANQKMALINPTLTLILNIGLVGIVLFGAYRVNDGLTEPGKIIAFLSYVTIISTAMMTITRIFIMISKASASAKRIEEIILLNNELETIDAPQKNSDFHIVFDNVSFSYLKSKNNLNNISFRIRKGQSLGIIGGTGSGKSTIVSLLMRFYDAQEGNIYIDGKNIKSFSLTKLREKFGVALQNDAILADSVYENISFLRKVSMDEIKEASKKAQASEFIDNMTDGYDSHINAYGTNLSGGQKQRLLISRALVSKKEILIFDDSTSALDYQTEARLRKYLQKEEATKIIIAQRVSAIKSCDVILVLENGFIDSIGSHEELLEKSNIYKFIYDTQMGGVL